MTGGKGSNHLDENITLKQITTHTAEAICIVLRISSLKLHLLDSNPGFCKIIPKGKYLTSLFLSIFVRNMKTRAKLLLSCCKD